MQAFLLESAGQPASEPAAGSGLNGHDADSDSSGWFGGTWFGKRRDGEQPRHPPGDAHRRGRPAHHSSHHHHSHAPSRDHDSPRGQHGSQNAAGAGKPQGFAALLQDGRTMQRLQQSGPALPSLPDTLVCRIASCAPARHCCISVAVHAAQGSFHVGNSTQVCTWPGAANVSLFAPMCHAALRCTVEHRCGAVFARCTAADWRTSC